MIRIMYTYLIIILKNFFIKIRRVRNLEAKRRRLENETEDDRVKRRARDAETKRVRRQRETSEQRARRLMRDSQRMRRTRRIKRF